MPRDPWDNAVIVDSDDPWDNAVVVDDEEDEDEPSFLERAGRFGMKTASYTPIPVALNLISKGAGDALVGAHEKAVMKGLSSGLSGLADLGRGIGDAFSPDTRDVELEAGDFAGREPGQAGAITRGGAGGWLDDIAGGIDRFAGRVTGSEGLAAGEADLARIGKGKWYDVPGELISNPKALASLAGSATGSLGSTMAMGTVGKVAPLIGIGLQELHGVEEAQRAEEEALGRNIAPGERLLRQLGTSGAIAALERIVPDELTKAAKGARGGAARALLTPVKEGATEGAQRAIADIWGTPGGVFDPTGTALEFGAGLLGGAALGPMHLGKGGQDLPEAPPRDHLREVLDFRQNLNDFKAAKAQRFFNEAHEKKKKTLVSLIEQEKAANAALAAEPTPRNRAQAFDIDAQRKALEAEIAQEEAGPRQLEPGARPSPKPTHVRDLTVQEEILLDRGTPKLGQARGGGATIGFRDEGRGAGRGVEEIAQTIQRWAQQDKAIPLDLIDIHDSVFDPAYYDQLSDSEKAEVEKARARGIEDAAISRATGTPGFYGQDGRIHVLAPRISNLGHLYDLITGHEGTHLAADEARGGAPDSAVAPEFYGASPGQRMRTQAALAKRAKGKDVLGHALRQYEGSSEAILAEEALANAAEMAPTQKAPGRIDRAVAAVRSALRENPLTAPLVSKASDAEIRVLLRDARKRLTERVPRPKAPAPVETAPPAETPAPAEDAAIPLQEPPLRLEDLNPNFDPNAPPTLEEIALVAWQITQEADAAAKAEEKGRQQEPAPSSQPFVDVGLQQEQAAAAQHKREAEAAAKAKIEAAKVADDERKADLEQAERDAKVKLQREREAAQQQEVVGGFPVAGADVLSSIAERGAVSPKPQERIPGPVAPIPVDTLIARTEEKNTKEATGKAPSPTPPPSVPPRRRTTTTTAPPGKAPKKKARHSIRTRFGYEERDRALDDYSLPDEKRRAAEDPEHWVRYAVPETASFSSDSAITSAKTTLRQFGIALDQTTPLEGVGKNGVWTRPTQAGNEVIITTWPDGRPAYAWSLNGKTVAWAAKFPGGQPVAKPSPETKTEKLARLLEQTDPSHPFRVMQGELAKRGVMRDPTTDALSEGGLATAELMAPADSFVKKFRRWAIDPRPIIGRVRYEHGDHAALTEDQIRTGLEQLRRGYFGMPEAHAINMLALDEERKELERYNKGGKIRTAEEAFRGADEARRMVGQTGAAEQAPEGLGRASVPGAGEGLVAGTPERGEAGRAGGRELPTARADAGVEEKPFPEAEEPLPPFKARYSMAGASAKTADRKELSRAQRMVRGGISDEETWKQTGWRRFPDGRWRFEISDHDAKLNEDVYKAIPFEHHVRAPKVTLGDLLSHDALFAAYPGLRDMRVYRADGGGEGAVAAIDKKTNEIFLYEGINKHPEGPLSFILHEIQHAIQETEGFAKGGSPDTVSRSVPESEARQYAEAESRSILDSADQIEEEAVKQESRATLLAPYSEKIKRAIEAQRDGRIEEAEAIRAEIYESVDKDEDMPLGWADEIRRSASIGATSTSVLKHADYLRRRVALMRQDAEKARAATGEQLQRYVDLHADTYEFYKRLAGEAEARQTQARLNLTPEERRARDPYLDFDVEPDRQLVDRRRYSVRGEPVTGPDGVRRLTIFHMSNRDDLEEIDPKFQGTAQAGAEMKRRHDEGFEPFSNWYTGEPGTVVEAHRFGGKPMYESEVELTNEPGGVIEAGRIEGRTAAQLKAEGYTGIYFPSHGQVQMFAPVRPAPVGTAPRPGRPVARGDEFYREATGREARFSRRQEETPEFKRWFGDWQNPKAWSSARAPGEEPVSQAVGPDGRPLVLYHGTRGDFGAFDAHTKGYNSNVFGSWETDRHAIFFAESPADAEAFTESGGDRAGGNIRPVYLNAKAPIDFTRDGEWFEDFLSEMDAEGVNPRWIRNTSMTWELFDGEDGRRFVDAAKRLGYDSVIFDDSNPDTGDSFRAWVVFDPTQIKSATGNTGAFDPTNPDVRYSKRKHGVGAERGERVTTTGHVNKSDARVLAAEQARLGFSDDVLRELRAEVKVNRGRYPASGGWDPLVLLGVQRDKKSGEYLLNWQKSGYGFSAPDPSVAARGPVDKAWVDKIAKVGTEEVMSVVRRADAGDKVAKNIIAQARWYRDMTERLRVEFGGAADLLADLLGAFSPGTHVAANWDNAITALRGFSRGEYRTELEAFEKWVSEGKKIGDFPAIDKIRKASGALFGYNSTNGMMALLDAWRAVQPGQAPKARNFTKNLIGESNIPTIDVWAARFLRRVADIASGGKFPRIPVPAETGVSGTWNAKGTAITGEFGFGAEALSEIAARLRARGVDTEGPDMQALLWFLEKEVWTRAGWTSGLGEGGSFDAEAEKAGLRRYMAAVTPAQAERGAPPDQEMVAAANTILASTQNDDAVVAARALPTLGMYEGSPERSLDSEITVSEPVQPDGQRVPWNPLAYLDSVADVAAKNNQTDAFVSKVLRDNEDSPNARPGVEIYFRTPMSQALVSRLDSVLARHGEKGYTLVVDPREARTNTGQTPGAFSGIRIQYVPEIDLRFGGEEITAAVKAGGDAIDSVLSRKALALRELAIEIEDDADVVSAELRMYDTLVFGKEDYGAYASESPSGADRDGGRKARFGEPTRRLVEEAARRFGVLDAAAGVPAADDVLQREGQGAGPVRYSRRPAVPFDFTRSTGPANIPLDAPQVESRVDKLVEGEGYLLHQGADYTPTSLKRDTPQSQDDVEQKSRRLDMTITDDKWVSLVNRNNRVLSATEQMAINARVALREVEMNDATTRRIEAERMSEADRKAKGLDVQTLIREEIEATLGYVAMQKASINAGTEAGRALAARKRIMAAGTELTPDMLTRKLLKEIPNASSKDVADLFQKYRTGDMAAFREGVRDAMAPGWARKYMEYFRGAGLLSGIGTHVANFTGNIGEPAFRLAETMYAAGADKVYSTLTGRPRERFLGEAKYELQGQLAAIPAAFGKFTSALYHQILLQEEPDVELSGKFDHQVGAISGKKGTLIRTSFRALGVADDFFKELGFAAALQKRAYREARREGLTGTAAEKRALEIASEGSMDPTGRWRSLMEAVAKERLERVFQEAPAKAIQSVMRITHDLPLLGLLVPFVKTPANITRAGWRRSPMGLLLPGDFWTKSRKYAAQQEALRAGKKVEGELVSRGEVEDALARASVGTTLAVAFGALAAAGLMTGGGPTDDEEKKAKRATGWQPYSFVIPGAGTDGKPLYLPYGRFEPASSLMGIVADAFELSDERDLLDKVLTSVATNWTNKTFFKGLNDAAQAIYRPQIAAKNWLGSTVAAHVPNIVAKGAEALDPTFRDRRSPSGLTGLGEFTKRGVLRRIPGASNTLEPMYSVTGEESPRPGNAFTRFVLPIQASSERPGTELEAYMAKIHEVPADVPRELVIPKALLPRDGERDWTGTRIHVTDEERAFLAKARRDAASQLRRQLTSLQRLPIDTQRKRIRDTFSDAQERAIKQLWARSQELRERARKKVAR